MEKSTKFMFFANKSSIKILLFASWISLLIGYNRKAMSYGRKAMSYGRKAMSYERKAMSYERRAILCYLFVLAI